MPNEKIRSLTRMMDEAITPGAEMQQMRNVVEWCKRNPLKQASIVALTTDERDRIEALLVSANGGYAKPLNVEVVVRPDDYNLPVHVRTQ